jgi:D-beta-D-heptose 7-phosphate kinase/D-beta-D-heptose 1-phosphate adenosyltransferase
MTGKIASLEEMRTLREELASQGRKVVFTNGCFDLLHVGHVHYLKEARKQGDLLIVGLNDDESTRHIKGPGRPLMLQEDRAEILAALECIDYVVIFSERTAERLVRILKPDIYVKGGNYKVEELPEAKVVAEYGGQVYLTSLTRGRSTTNLLSAILAHCKREGR